MALRQGGGPRRENERVRRKQGRAEPRQFPFCTANRILSLDATPVLRGPQDSLGSGLSSLHTHLAAS